jgi:hypothetical protein
MRSARNNWDFWTLLPEALHQVTITMSDRGIPASYRHMHGYGSHTFSLINAEGKRTWVKFHLHTQQGIKNLTDAEAEAIIAKDRESHQRDLYESIEKGDFPKWTMYIQVMTEEQAKNCPFNPFDLTKVWSQKEYPLIEVRVDYNVPLTRKGAVADDFRIRMSVPTVRALLDQGCKVVVISHLGRPEGKVVPALSLEPAALRLAELLDEPVRFVDRCIGPRARMAVKRAPRRSVIVLENLRFHPEETANSPKFARELAAASGASLFVQDGFGVVHRAHASTSAIQQKPERLSPNLTCSSSAISRTRLPSL